MSKQNETVKFLYEASKHLPYNELFTAIRSNMVTKCTKLSCTKSLKLDLVPRCEACGVVFEHVPPIHFVETVKKPTNYKQLKNGAKCNTKYQVLSVKKFNKYKNDKQLLVRQCTLCKNLIKNPMKKIGHIRTKVNHYNLLDDLKDQKNIKKKRKKNDEYAGLCKSAVLLLKRKLETIDNNNCSPKKMKTEANANDLISPDAKKMKNKSFSTPKTLETINLVTPNTNNKNDSNIVASSQNSDVICLDSPRRTVNKCKNLNDMFTPVCATNKKIIEISDSEVQPSGNSTIKKLKKNKKEKKQKVQQIEQTPKIKKNNNVVLVAEQSTSDKKKKKLNNLSIFLKNASNIQKSNQNNTLQTFLSNFI